MVKPMCFAKDAVSVLLFLQPVSLCVPELPNHPPIKGTALFY